MIQRRKQCVVTEVTVGTYRPCEMLKIRVADIGSARQISGLLRMEGVYSRDHRLFGVPEKPEPRDRSIEERNLAVVDLWHALRGYEITVLVEKGACLGKFTRRWETIGRWRRNGEPKAEARGLSCPCHTSLI